jgi:hypothetical protein
MSSVVGETQWRDDRGSPDIKFGQMNEFSAKDILLASLKGQTDGYRILAESATDSQEKERTEYLVALYQGMYEGTKAAMESNTVFLNDGSVMGQMNVWDDRNNEQLHKAVQISREAYLASKQAMPGSMLERTV